MPWIRIFKTRYQAEEARDILKKGGIDSFVLEDTFYGVELPKYRVPARYSLNVRNTKDYYRAAEYLSKLIKKK